MKNSLWIVYFASFFLVFSFSADAQIITTIVGTGVPGYTGDGGAATTAKINYSSGITVDGSGNIYISDWGNSCIRKVNSAGVITTVAGNGTAGYTGDGGPATLAEINAPDQIYADNVGNVYFAEYVNHIIRKISTAGIISTVAGNGTSGYSGDGGQATAAELNNPIGITLDGSGNLYISDFIDNRIRKVNTLGIISTFAGNGIAGYTGDGVAATATELYHPDYLITDGSGNVFFCDDGNQRVRKINTGGIIYTVAGNGIAGYSSDGVPATASELFYPGTLGLDIIGNLYISDYSNQRIRKVNTLGIISTFAGTGVAGYSGDGIPATASELNNPIQVTLDNSGNILISDSYNNRIRKVIIGNYPPFIAGTIQNLLVCEGEAPTLINSLLSITDPDAGQTETWSLSTSPVHGTVVASYIAISTGGTLTPSGLTYTPALGYTGSDIFMVSVTDGIATTIVTVNVLVGTFPNAGVISGVDSVCPGQTVTLSETVTGGIWSNSNISISNMVSSGIATGVAPGRDTVIYTVITDCSIASTIFPINVRSYIECNTGVRLEGGTNKETINVYPNPSTGKFTLNVSAESVQEAFVTITNIIGEKVIEFSILANKPTEVVLKEQPGIYFINVLTTSGRYMERGTITR